MQLQSTRTVEEGIAHHQAGRLREAEAIYRAVLTRNPRDADALQLLGTLAGQCGQLEAAIQLLNRAIEVNPNYTAAIQNLGALLARAGRTNEAIAVYQKALAQNPASLEIQIDLGKVLLHENQFSQAVSAFEAAAAIQPLSAENYTNLSTALRKNEMHERALAASRRTVALGANMPRAHFEHAKNLSEAGRSDEALGEYRHAVRLQPNFYEACNNLGKILAELGRLDDAVEVYATAIGINPNNALLHFNMGKLLSQADRPAAAAEGFTAAIKAAPDYFEAYAELAKVLAKLQKFEKAREAQAAAERLAPNAAVTHEAMGEIALRQLDSKAAVTYFQRAYDLDPESVEASLGLSTALQSQGLFEEAQAHLNRALKLQSRQVTGTRQLVKESTESSEAEIKRLTKLLTANGLNPSLRGTVEFNLGKILDEMDRFDEAFPHFANGNSIVKQFRVLGKDIYDPAEFRRWIDLIIQRQTPEFFQQRKGWGEASDVPVFIVGMPRSGTTLLHQIVAAHPDIHGVGERADISHAVEAIGNGSRTAAFDGSRDAVAKTAREVLERYQALNPSALRIVDKMPMNVELAGFISVMFPASRIILCRRDPRDTCLSCFFQNFATENLFSFDLVDCGLRQIQVYRLMDHWLKVLPVPVLEVQYEDVVADLEGEARRLIDFIGLPWNPACLKFEKSKAAVLTASVKQVRQPIYNRSVGRWRHYERHLQPLLETLGEIPARG